MNLKEYSRAKTALEKSLTIKPSATGWYQMGVLADAEGQESKALGHCEQATRIDPSMVDAWSKIATIYVRMHEQSKAAEAFEKVAQLQPNNPFWWNLHGESQLQNHDYSGAEQSFRRVLKLNGQDFAGTLGLARALADQSKFEEAKSYVDRAAGLPDSSGLFQQKIKSIQAAIAAQTPPDGAGAGMIGMNASSHENQEVDRKNNQGLKSEDKSKHKHSHLPDAVAELTSQGSTNRGANTTASNHEKNNDGSSGEKTEAKAPEPKKPTAEELRKSVAQAVNNHDYPVVIDLCSQGLALTNSDSYFIAQRGNAELICGLYKDALSDLDTAIKLKSKDPSLLMNRASALFKLKDFQSALEAYNVVLKKGYGNIEALTGKGKCLQNLNRFEEAVIVYESIMRQSQNNECALDLAFCLNRMGQPSRALPILNNVIATQSGNSKAFKLRCSCFIGMHDLNRANDDATQATKLEPSDYDGWLLRAFVESQKGLPRDAIDSVERAQSCSDSEPSVQQAMQIYASQLLGVGNSEINQKPNDPQGYDDAAYANIYLKNYANAIQLAQKAISLGGNNSKLYCTLGTAYLEQHNYPEALKSLTKGILINPKDSNCYFERSRAAGALDKYSDSIKDLQTYISIAGDDYVAYSNMAGYELRLGDTARATENLRKCLSMAPRYTFAMYRMATVLQTEGRSQEALEWINRCLNEKPDDSNAVFYRAYIAEATGDWAKAELLYSQAAQQFSQDLFLLDSIAERLAGLGRFDKAKELEKRIVNQEPNSGEHAMQNALVLITCRDYESAISEAQRAAKLDHSQLGEAINVHATALDLNGQASEGINLIKRFISDPVMAESDKYMLSFMMGVMAGELGHNEEALKYLQQSASMLNPAQSLYTDVACMGPWWIYKQVNQASKAATFIASNNPNFPADAWPNIALRFLRGELKPDQIESTGISIEKKTDIYALMGIKAIFEGNSAEADRCFHWLDTKGHPFSNWYMALHGVYLRSHGKPQH